MQNKIVPKVLIVDDLKDNRLMIKLALKKSGEYIFLEASNGQEGLDISKKELPHIILMDAIMPVMDGFESISLLRRCNSTKKIPILMVSALDREDDKVKALTSGISDFISKPFDKIELIIRVNSLLNLNIKFLQKEQELQDLNIKIKELHDYDKEQQYIAKEKLEVGIVNDMDEKEARVMYLPFDILSGDFYSLHNLEDGSKFIYIIDGQGHGVSAALTIFAVSSSIKKLITKVSNLEELSSRLFPIIKKFLGEIEQLSYTFIMISPDSKQLSYMSGGMYPFLVKNKNIIIKLKANNLPFMDFSSNPLVDTIDINGWESMIIYSDGLIEHNNSDLDGYTPLILLNEPALIDVAVKKMSKLKLEDDVTLVYIKNKGCFNV